MPELQDRPKKSNQKKIGNKFQEDFFKSVPTVYYIERYKDSPSMYKKVHNPADFFLMGNVMLIQVECKTVQGISFPFSNITWAQLFKMVINCTKTNVVGGYLINFRDLEKTYYIRVQDLLVFMVTSCRKSIPEAVLRDIAVLVPQKKKRTRYAYDIDYLIRHIER